MVPKVKIEVACASDQAPAVIEAIQHAAETGAIGDGKIFEFDLAGALRIRTGDTNVTAL
jgi:nitrogen regulatory protein P-II 2